MEKLKQKAWLLTVGQSAVQRHSLIPMQSLFSPLVMCIHLLFCHIRPSLIQPSSEYLRGCDQWKIWITVSLMCPLACFNQLY